MIELLVILGLITSTYLVFSTITTDSYKSNSWYMAFLISLIMTGMIAMACALTSVSHVESYDAKIIPTEDGLGFLIYDGKNVEVSHDIRLVGRNTITKIWTHHVNKFGLETSCEISYAFQ